MSKYLSAIVGWEAPEVTQEAPDNLQEMPDVPQETPDDLQETPDDPQEHVNDRQSDSQVQQVGNKMTKYLWRDLLLSTRGRWASV
jgi:hypothetical protein